MEEKIQARLILEILGRPASNVTEALNSIVAKIGAEKGARIVEKHMHEPLPVKDTKDLFSSFAEIIIECDSLSVFFGIVFAYMPSNIELLNPSNFTLQGAELSLIANRILGRLHNYDAIARRLVVDNTLLKQKLGIAPQPEPVQQTQTQPKAKQKRKQSKKKTKKK